jgi:hypothetical protein
MLTWPALLNRFPILYPDSATYIGDGRPVAAALFVHRPASLFAMRSEIYSVGIFGLHWNRTLWPVVAMNSLLAAYVIWLVVRSLLPQRTTAKFLLIMPLLSLFSSLSWYVSLIMPDIFGALGYLCMYLLIFGRESLSKVERWSLAPIVWWSAVAHSTHLLLAGGLWCLLLLLLLLRWGPIAGRGRGLTEIAAMIAVAAATLLGLHAYLYRQPSLTGNRLPYLMARSIADGPGRWYLLEHCATLDWAICDHVHNLPVDEDDFLWTPGGVWDGANDDTQKRLLAEETPLIMASIRAYPGAQAKKSLANFGRQLITFSVNDFDNNTWMEETLSHEMPAAHARYLRSLQAHDVLPTERFSVIQRWALIVAVIMIVVLLPLAWRRQPLLAGLAVVVVPAIVANAFVTAVLSSIDPRFQARVVWLIPLLALLVMLDRLASRSRSRRNSVA